MSEKPHIAPLFSAEDEPCISDAQMRDYRDGKLAAAEKHHVERHLLNCELCALAHEGLVDLSPAEIAAATADLTDRAWKRVAETEQKRRRSAVWWMSSAAAILLIIVTSFFVIDSGNSDQELTAIANKMMEESDLPEGEEETFAEAAPMEELENATNSATAEPELKAMERMEDARDQSEMQEVPSLDAPSEDVTIELDLSPVKESNPFQPSPDDLEVVEEEAEEMVEVSDNWTFAGGTMGVGDAKVDAPKRDDAGDMSNKDFAADLRQSAPLPNADKSGFVLTDSVGGAGFDDFGDFDGESMAYFESDDAEMEDADEVMDGVDLGAVIATEPFVQNQSTIAANDLVESEKTIALDEVAVTSTGRRNEEGGYLFERGNRAGRSKKAKASAPSREANEQVEKEERSIDYYELGLNSFQNKDFPKSAQYMRQAAEDFPANYNAHYYAARSFIELEQYTAALYHLERILAQDNGLTQDALWLKSVVMLRQGKKAEAEQLLRQISEGGGNRAKKAEKILEEDF